MIGKNVKVVDEAKFNKFLCSYICTHKKNQEPTSSPSKKSLSHQHNHPSRPSQPNPLNIPTAKTIKPSSTSPQITHPMPLHHHTQIAPYYGTNFKLYAAQQLILQSQPTFSPKLQPIVNHIYDNSGKCMTIDNLIKKDPKTWKPSVSNELGHTTNGIQNIKGNQVLVFIKQSSIPEGSKIMYGNMV